MNGRQIASDSPGHLNAGARPRSDVVGQSEPGEGGNGFPPRPSVVSTAPLSSRSSKEELQRWSSRTDPALGILEEASFFGTGPSKLFGCLHRPLSEPVGGLIICCPFQAELQRNYRREVLVARELAAHGIAAQRFHYRGTGHSDAPTAEITFETMREDALLAEEELRRRTGVSRVGFLGTRWGALVAAAAAASMGGHLALWEPVTDAERYFDDVLRFRLISEVKRDPRAQLTPDVLLAELWSTGSVDVLGHPLDRAVYESALGLTLAGQVGDGVPATLLVQIAQTKSIRREYAELAASLRERGIPVEHHAVTDRETWWISGDLWQTHDTHGPTRRLVELTREWAVRQLTDRSDA